MRNPDLPGQVDDALAAIVSGELATLVGAAGDPRWVAITRWTHAIPQYNLGHVDRMRPIDDAERALPGLRFCASYRGGVSVGDCIKSAHATAEATAGFLQGLSSGA
jgi:oxygen-dependent protoporphyrinogen oxidase